MFEELSPPADQVCSTPGILQNADPRCWRAHRFGLPRPRWNQLYGRAFWVTGAGSGYGRSIALALAAGGATVFLTGRRIEKLRETQDEGVSLGISRQNCIPITANITLEPDLKRAVGVISQHVTQLHGLVNSAALPQPNTGPYPLANQSLSSWTQLLTTNVTAQWLTSRAALPLLANSGSLRMLFLSSEAGWAATPGFGPYNLSKSAVNTLGTSFAAECSTHYPAIDVQINVIVPGEALTEMNRGSTESPYCVVSIALALLSHPPKGPNGRFFHRDGRHLGFAYSDRYAKNLLEE